MKKETQDHHYTNVLAPFSAEELALIVQLKRVFEWTQGDPDFRSSLESGEISSEYRDRLTRIGVTFELDEIALLWKTPELFGQVWETIQTRYRPEFPEETVKIVTQYPLLTLWFRYVLHRQTIYRAGCAHTYRIPGQPRFDAWRLRRIAAVRNELGCFGQYLSHPILAFEFGDGCSVGCWFCAFATRKLTRNFDYPANREFFRRVAQHCVEIFGKKQANLALLYYGTEPHDNPHYLDMMKEYEEITGYPVCTSTAVVTDTGWLRDLIAYYRRGNYPWPRLSVLSKEMLFKIHDLYSPEELRDVELLLQMRGHERPKVSGGRILEEHQGLREREAGHYLDGIVPQGSIACVTGFLINMVHRTIQLTSPCYTSQTWPYGYRVFDERTFTDADDFRRAIEELIERNMPEVPFSDKPARFRDDLVYHPTDEGFDLTSPNQVHHVRGEQTYKPLGRLIAEKSRTYRELYDEMLGSYGINPMIGVAVVKKLFDAGFLDEVWSS